MGLPNLILIAMANGYSMLIIMKYKSANTGRATVEGREKVIWVL